MRIDAQSGPGHAPRSVQPGDMSEFKAFERGGSPAGVYDGQPHPVSRDESSKIRQLSNDLSDPVKVSLFVARDPRARECGAGWQPGKAPAAYSPCPKPRPIVLVRDYDPFETAPAFPGTRLSPNPASVKKSGKSGKIRNGRIFRIFPDFFWNAISWE